MINSEDWQQIELPELSALPSAVYLRAQSLNSRQMFPTHSHSWHQFVYATSGTLTVTVADTWYVITPEQAIWLPKGLKHATGALNHTEFRSLYINAEPLLKMPTQCTLYEMNALLPALIGELERLQQCDEPASYHEQINQLICAQLPRLTKQHLHLPWPKSPPLRQLCETLYNEPCDPRSAEQWAQQLGVSGRTLGRRFERESGVTLRDWRHKLRLFLAVEWLCAGRNITEIALDLGYASTSAFSYMFRQAMGVSPSDWRSR